MNRNGQTRLRRPVVDWAAAAIEQMKHYCATSPGSPSAVRGPQLFFRGDLWIAVLGPSVEEGIVGIGPTVPAALRAFDAQYMVRSCQPNEEIRPPIKPQRSPAVPLSRRPDC